MTYVYNPKNMQSQWNQQLTTSTVRLQENLGYTDLVKKDTTVSKKLICNELGHLSQGQKSHARTDTIEFIFHKDKHK